MSSTTTKTTIVSLVCASVAIFVMMVGISVSASVRTTGGAAMARPMAQIAQQGCQTEVPGIGQEAACLADDNSLAKMASCPMLGFCGGMAAGASHCGPTALTESPGIQPTTFAVVTLQFRHAGVRASGLSTDPLFQPPIV